MSGPEDQGMVRLFDLSDSPAMKRAAIERYLIEQARDATRHVFTREGWPVYLVDTAQMTTKLRVAVQPAVDAAFMQLVD